MQQARKPWLDAQRARLQACWGAAAVGKQLARAALQSISAPSMGEDETARCATNRVADGERASS